jgi:hypothetical protein
MGVVAVRIKMYERLRRKSEQNLEMAEGCGGGERVSRRAPGCLPWAAAWMTTPLPELGGRRGQNEMRR